MCGEFCTLPALFLKIIFNFSFFESAWLFCLGTLSIGVPAAGLGMNSSLRDPAAQPKNGVRERERSGSGAAIGKQYLPAQQPLGLLFQRTLPGRSPRLHLLWALASTVGERWAVIPNVSIKTGWYGTFGSITGHHRRCPGAPTPLCRHRRIEGEPDPGACANSERCAYRSRCRWWKRKTHHLMPSL
jgi:hypothetical protein